MPRTHIYLTKKICQELIILTKKIRQDSYILQGKYTRNSYISCKEDVMNLYISWENFFLFTLKVYCNFCGEYKQTSTYAALS